MSAPIATVFGGTGFLGRRVVRKFAEAGFHVRVAARHPAAAAFPDVESGPDPIAVDIRDEQAVAAAVKGAKAVVNAVSLYAERGALTFDAIHVEGAGRVARHCDAAGVASLVHISGIGAAPASESALIRAKGGGEHEVGDRFPAATIFRPSVMFGRGDAFVSGIERATRAPVVPLFGRGRMRMQPAWVQDVALAAVKAVNDSDSRGTTFELGGARVVTYREAVEAVCDALGRIRLLVPFPMEGWRLLVAAMQVLPNPPLTADQLHLLATDNTVSQGFAGFPELAIEPRSMLDMLEHCFAEEEA